MNHAEIWCIVSLLSLGAIGFSLYVIHRKLDRLHVGSGAEAMGEAKSAHTRIDRIDNEMRGDRHDLGVMRAMADVIKGRLTFLMHRDVSNEIRAQSERDEAANADKTDP